MGVVILLPTFGEELSPCKDDLASLVALPTGERATRTCKAYILRLFYICIYWGFFILIFYESVNLVLKLAVINGPEYVHVAPAGRIHLPSALVPVSVQAIK